MKRFLCTLCSIMLLFVLSANAQLFKESGVAQIAVSPQILETVDKISRQPAFKSTRRVQMASPVEFKQLTRDKKLGFAVPGSGKTFAYNTKRIDYKSDAEYVWYGMDSTDADEALIIFKDGKTFGNFKKDETLYKFYTLDDGEQILIEMDIKKNPFICPSPPLKSTQIPKPSGQARQAACAGEPLRVLFTYNTASYDSGLPLSQIAYSSMVQYNQVMHNSNMYQTITNHAEMVGIVFQEFIESGTNNDASFAPFDNLRANGILNLRDQYNADIVIQFRNNTYSYWGLANGIAIGNADYSLSIVVAAYADYHVVDHEIGHLLGASHEDYAPPGAPYARGHSYQTSSGAGYGTIMYVGYNYIYGIYSRAPYFSNPDVLHGGTPTGTADRNNARRISEWSPTVGSFRHSPGPAVTIDGPAVVFAAGNYTYEAVYQCRAFQSATWQTSTNGYNYTTLTGTGESISIYIGQQTYVRVTVTYVGGGTATSTRIINAFCPGCRTGTEVVDTDPESPIYPNPANEEATVKFTLTEKAEVSRMIVNMAGKPVERLNFGTIEAGTHEQKINVRSLPPAMYMINLRLGNKTVRQKLLIVR